MLEKTLNLLRAWKRKIEHYINIIYNIFHNRINTKYIDSIELHIARSAKNAQIYDCHPQSWIKLQHKEQEVVLFDKRFSDRKEFRLFREISWYISRATHIFYLPNFRICGENGFIVSTDGYICKQFTYPIRSRRWAITDFLGQGRLKSSTVATGWYTTLAAPTAYNYFHWMLECLPRMAILEKYVEIFDGIVIPANPSPFHLESLTALGICPKKLVATSPTINIQAEHLFVTDYSARDNPPPWLHVWYKEKFIQKIVHDVSTIQKHHFRKIYISRNDASQRKVTNHAEVHRMVQDLGFEVVYLSKLTFLAQADLFYQADIIVGEHGAGLANLLFPGHELK